MIDIIIRTGPNNDGLTHIVQFCQCGTGSFTIYQIVNIVRLVVCVSVLFRPVDVGENVNLAGQEWFGIDWFVYWSCAVVAY